MCEQCENLSQSMYSHLKFMFQDRCTGQPRQWWWQLWVLLRLLQPISVHQVCFCIQCKFVLIMSTMHRPGIAFAVPEVNQRSRLRCWTKSYSMWEFLNVKSRQDDIAHGDAVVFGGPTQVFLSIILHYYAYYRQINLLALAQGRRPT